MKLMKPKVNKWIKRASNALKKLNQDCNMTGGLETEVSITRTDIELRSLQVDLNIIIIKVTGNKKN